MSIHALPSNAELLRGNRFLPDELRERAVFVQFAQPMPAHCCEQFLRIHLTRKMLAGGESEFFQPEITQAHRVSNQRCPVCKGAMSQVGLFLWECQSIRCHSRDMGLKPVAGPVRGVVDVKTEFDAKQPGGGISPVSFLVGREDKTIDIGNGKTAIASVDMVIGCLLILDRRYDPSVLAAVYRTAGHLCDEQGWKMK